MINKDYCMSSYLAFRYIERDDVDFYQGMHHRNIVPVNESEKIPVKTAADIDIAIAKQIKRFEGRKKGILLSGGMDSAIVASYLSGADAYTFRFLDGKYQTEELQRAEYYARYYNLNLHYVDINWETVLQYLKPVMQTKAAPVHSIEPQILQAALQAKSDGIELIFIGESSDLIFGGMDQLLAYDWNFTDFMNRYIFTKPEYVLNNPIPMQYVFERYRINNDKIDFLSFMNDIFSIESSSSYMNAFEAAEIAYYDPYSILRLDVPLDLHRIRNGEPKYLIRELMAKKYPDIPVPSKIPMPRPVDEYFKDWNGPRRPEFLKNLRINQFTGNQKWQIWCLERFLDFNE